MRSLLFTVLIATTAMSPGRAGPIVAEPVSGEVASGVLAGPEQVPTTPGRAIVVEQAADGLFYLSAQVNGVSVRFVVDSGASVVVLNASDAARARVASAGSVAVDTAGGSAAMRRARIARVELSGGQMLSGVDAAVVDRGLEVSLLGQSALSQLGSVTFRKTRLELE